MGQDQQQFMHTISAGDQTSPPMVMLPGYGAGSAFYFRNIAGLAQHFRLHCVDLLGTGMSGTGISSMPGLWLLAGAMRDWTLHEAYMRSASISRDECAFGQAYKIEAPTSMSGSWIPSQKTLSVRRYAVCHMAPCHVDCHEQTPGASWVCLGDLFSNQVAAGLDAEAVLQGPLRC